jgi:hypothetical protein
MPKALVNDHLKAIEAKMSERQVEPSIMQNVIQWQKQRHKVRP